MPTLKPGKYAEEHVRAAVHGRFGDALADCLSLRDSHCLHLFSSCTVPPNTAENLIKRKLFHENPWGNIAACHFRAVYALHSDRASPDHLGVFESQKSLVSAYNDWFRSEDAAWSLPVLYVICRDLREHAIKADEALVAQGEKPGKLAEAARLIQRSLSEETKKIGVLFMASTLFKTYFKLKSVALCKNVIRGVENAGLLSGFKIPMAHRVTYRYYMGVLAFFQQEYDKAEEHLDFAFRNCHRGSHRNRELILAYLIPMRLSKGKRPIPALLKGFGRLSELYQPFISAIKSGHIELFDRHMARAEKRLMERGTYLVVERCRDVCLRNMVKLIHCLESGSFRLPLVSFRTITYDETDTNDKSSVDLDSQIEEVECVLANLIAQDRVRGYIHHQAKMLVLSKLDPFPAQTTIKV